MSQGSRVLPGAKRTRGRPGTRAGFTIVEVMIAVGVLLVAAVTAFGSQLTSFRLMNSSREDTVAIADLAACMEGILALPVAEIPVAGSDYEHGQPVAAYEGVHLRDQRMVATYPGYAPGGPVPDELAIVLTATWTGDRGHPRRLELRSLKVR